MFPNRALKRPATIMLSLRDEDLALKIFNGVALWGYLSLCQTSNSRAIS